MLLESHPFLNWQLRRLILVEKQGRVLMETIHEKPPGLEATQQFFDSLKTMENVDSNVAEIISQLHSSGQLNAKNIVSALRKSRAKDSTSNDD